MKVSEREGKGDGECIDIEANLQAILLTMFQNSIISCFDAEK